MKFNVTIESPSPLIAAGLLSFNGTAIWLQSGIPTTASYVVNFDSTEFSYQNGQPSPNLLFHATSLDENMEHNVLIQPASILDSVIVEMDLGDQADAIMSLDDSMLFQEDDFTTKGQWTKDACLGTGRAAGTCHVSEGTGSEFSYTFEGDAITVWGAVEGVDSLYTVSIDGLQPTPYSPPNITSSRPITVLAHASNLGAGSHTFTLTSQPKDGKSRVEIDSVQLYAKTTSGSSTVASGSTSGTSTTGEPDGAASGGLSKTAKIAIIGGVVCGFILLGSLVAFFLLVLKRNNRAAAHSRNPTYTSGALAASGIRVDHKAHSRDYDEETLAGSVADLKKDGLELGPIESQTRLPPGGEDGAR